jgi:hypothetical protein
VTVFIAAIALAALVLMIGIEIAVLRNRKKKKVQASAHRHARRQPLIEYHMRGALEEPRAQYGDIFTSYNVWKHGQQTRLELFSGDPWLQLNEFTRAIVVRHIWRALEKLAKGSVVVVDQPPLEWSAATNDSFDDQGIDPWAGPAKPKTPGNADAPVFIKDKNF